MVVRAVLTMGALALVAGAAAHEPPAADAAPALKRFASCDAFAGHMRRQAVRMVTPYGLPGVPGPALPVADLPVMAVPMPAAPLPATGPQTRESAPVEDRDYSGTNLQEAGVDEPDIVKTDGTRMYTLTDGVVRVLALGAGAPRTLGSIDLSRVGAQSLMLVDGTLLVLAQEGYGPIFPEPMPMPMPAPAVSGPAATSSAPATVVAPEPRPISPPPDAAIAPVQPQPLRVVVMELDVSDPGNIRVRGRVTAEGTLVAARRTGTALRLVVSSAADPAPLVGPEASTTASVRAAGRQNRRALAATTASDWLPRMTVRRRATGATVKRVMAGCRAVSAPRVFSGLGMVTVMTLATDRGLTVTDSDAILTDGQTVYASPSSLYIATPRWVNPAADTGVAPAPRGTTLIHRLDTTSPTVTERGGSATVPGYTLNQFSLSEYQGHLRVATTEEPEWWSAPQQGETSQSHVTVLSTAGGRLTRTGQVSGIGRGERIYAVRFLGARGYVVTFRQTDPLYSLDLADPAAPRVTGELKIDGYSAYLHPIDDGTLIGIGQDATPEGRTLGTQVSLFDVTDPAAPKRLAQMRLGSGYSEAEDNHLAVLYWRATGTLVIPLTSWGGPDGGEPPFTGAAALGVTRAAGITDIGRITHPDGFPIRRAVVVGDAVYTLSPGGVRKNALAGLADGGYAAFR